MKEAKCFIFMVDLGCRLMCHSYGWLRLSFNVSLLWLT